MEQMGRVVICRVLGDGAGLPLWREGCENSLLERTRDSGTTSVCRLQLEDSSVDTTPLLT